MTSPTSHQSPSPSATTNAPRWAVWVLSLVVLAATFAAFIPSIGNQFLDWDDNANFTDNPSWRGLGAEQLRWMFGTFHNGHYQPITWLTLGLDHIVAGAIYGEHAEHEPGMDPRVYHFSNVLYHAINAVLVYLVALRLLGCALLRDLKARTWMIHLAAMVAALLWGVHPLRVENVAWITERRDVVSAGLMLMTVLAYLKASQLEGGRRWRWLSVSIVMYVLSLMAKVSGVPLPVALLAIDWYPLRRMRGSETASARSVWLEKLPYFAVALVFAYIASKGQSSNRWMYPLADHPMDARILVCFYGLMFYAWKTIAPFNLLPLYELSIPMDKSQAQFIVAMIVVGIGGLAIIVLLFLRRLPGLVVAAICYAAFLGPVLGLFQNGPQIVADRYAYLPSIGLMILLTGGVAWWLMRPRNHQSRRWTALTAGLVIAAMFGAAAWNQGAVWRTSETLWTYQLQHDPESAVGNVSLGLVIALEKHQPAEAIPYFRKAVERDPYSKKYRQNLRMALREAGMFPDLVQAWLDEAALFRGSPTFEHTAQWHLDAGTQALVKEQHHLALEHLTVSVSLNDQQPLAFSNLGVAMERLQQWDAAKTAYRRAIELDSRMPNPRFGLALMLSREGKQAEAIREAEALVQLNPDDANAKYLLAQLRAAQR